MRSTLTVVRRAAEALGRRRRGVSEEEGGGADESGFTLIELMVVLLIMGILMAIAIPTFLGATKGAHDKSAESNLVNAMTSAKTQYAQNGSYPKTTTMVTDLHGAEPELKFSSTYSQTTKTLSVATGTTTGSKLALAAYSVTTTICWVAFNNASTGTLEYGYLAKTKKTTKTSVITTMKTCTAAAAEAGTNVVFGPGNQFPNTPATH